ncbi:YdcF family protein [Mucilaginibacter conchicola]|nr:YdcF family protein [Mucilaginibacter conchicola]
MYFILSKVLLAFAMPLFWAFALFVYAAITRKGKQKQKALIAGIIVFYLFSIRTTADGFARLWDKAPAQLSGKKYSAIILLGGFVSEDETGNGFFNWAGNRYYTAVNLLKDSTAGRILFTGGNASLYPDKFNEVSFVKKAFRQSGVADSLVLLDSNARNTDENAKFSKVLLQKSGLKGPYLLVTSAFHVRRAALIFKKHNIEVIPYPCNYLETKHFSTEAIIPNADAIELWNLYIKEVIGYVVALVR